jgi:membrane-associated HD superfamily phosphohydrolase
VDSYLGVAEQMQKSDSEFQIDFYTKMGLRNRQIEENVKKDEQATDEYVKVHLTSIEQHILDTNAGTQPS